MNTQYWVIESPEAKKLWEDMIKQRGRFQRHVKKIIKKYKAKSAATRKFIDGLVFNSRADVPSGWVKDRYCRNADIYRPPSRGKQFSEARDELKAVANVTGEGAGKIFLGREMVWN